MSDLYITEPNNDIRERAIAYGVGIASLFGHNYVVVSVLEDGEMAWKGCDTLDEAKERANLAVYWSCVCSSHNDEDPDSGVAWQAKVKVVPVEKYIGGDNWRIVYQTWSNHKDERRIRGAHLQVLRVGTYEQCAQDWPDLLELTFGGVMAYPTVYKDGERAGREYHTSHETGNGVVHHITMSLEPNVHDGLAVPL